MEIQVSTSFLGSITQDKFSVKTIDHQNTKEYEGTYNAGEWAFKLFEEERIVLESQRVKLPGKETFLGHEQYNIFYNGEQIAVLKKSYLKRHVIFNEKQYDLPKLFKPSISELRLTFPTSTWIGRRKVKSYCTAVESDKIMLGIAITIFMWLTRNAISAD